MKKLRLLVVEDNDQDLKTCRDSVVRYQAEKEIEIELVECKNLSAAFEKLDPSFDGAIIDLKLDNDGTSGNAVVKRIEDFKFRIPVAILTGTPASAEKCQSSIGTFKKGEKKYSDLLDTFNGIYDTGLTRIMGGRGEIERTLSSVFHEMLSQNEPWVAYGAMDSVRTEKALLRHTLNYLLQLLDGDVENCFPEEVYLYPAPLSSVNTGTILKKKNDGNLFFVLSPACDLVVRDSGRFKTDRILIAEIDSEEIYSQMRGILKSKDDKGLKKIENCPHHNLESECYKETVRNQKDILNDRLSKLLKNNHDLFHHWLPKTHFFAGGFVNFRKLHSKTIEEFKNDFVLSRIQVAPSFVKDIVARFSSYYARQGQPDIDCHKMMV